MESTKEYRERVFSTLIQEIPAKLLGGNFRGKNYPHILKLEGKKKKKDAIETLWREREYLIDIPDAWNGLHTCAHHLNSSQLLCFTVFGLMDAGAGEVSDQLSSLLTKCTGTQVEMGQKCKFEYNDGMQWEEGGEPEKTQFDFHVGNPENPEVFFEIKFTEPGFGAKQCNATGRDSVFGAKRGRGRYSRCIVTISRSWGLAIPGNSTSQVGQFPWFLVSFPARPSQVGKKLSHLRHPSFVIR